MSNKSRIIYFLNKLESSIYEYNFESSIYEYSLDEYSLDDYSLVDRTDEEYIDEICIYLSKIRNIIMVINNNK